MVYLKLSYAKEVQSIFIESLCWIFCFNLFSGLITRSHLMILQNGLLLKMQKALNFF